MNTREKPPRIGTYRWEQARPNAIAVYNGNYSPSGRWIGPQIRPWMAAGPKVFETFHAHHEALEYALKKARQ